MSSRVTPSYAGHAFLMEPVKSLPLVTHQSLSIEHSVRKSDQKSEKDQKFLFCTDHRANEIFGENCFVSQKVLQKVSHS